MKRMCFLSVIVLAFLAAPAARALDQFSKGCYVLTGKWHRIGETAEFLVHPGSKMEASLAVEDVSPDQQLIENGALMRVLAEVVVPGRGSNARIRVLKELDPDDGQTPVQFKGPAPC